MRIIFRLQLTVITIQPFSIAYQAQVLHLIESVQQVEFGAPVTLADQPDLLRIPEFYQIGKGNFWLALDQTNVVGTIALIDIDNHQAALRKMFVQQEYRGKPMGVGQQLLDTLLDWARDYEIYEIFLGTIALFKAAHRFYEKNQFVQIDRDDLPASFPVMPGDTHFYKRSARRS